ncbi:hypothetical protein QF035_010899 [Streptomyces umbrinus]|uniref:Uncharacterized protein n=1 Tax=Streptomyces umbrinus TaxID=67370 RepID=A0ABU0TBY2_9ACTN|nr:hypothetical protein [Streptomyces umbrinus]
MSSRLSVMEISDFAQREAGFIRAELTDDERGDCFNTGPS